MKRTLALLVSAMMLTGALSGCGTDKTGTTGTTGTTGGSGSGTTTSNSTTSSSKTTTTSPSTSGTGTTSATGANTTGTKTSGTTSASTTKQHAIIRGTSYGQMLRNGRVHDTNGILTDGENAVTPGAATY